MYIKREIKYLLIVMIIDIYWSLYRFEAMKKLNIMIVKGSISLYF